MTQFFFLGKLTASIAFGEWQSIGETKWKVQCSVLSLNSDLGLQVNIQEKAHGLERKLVHREEQESDMHATCHGTLPLAQQLALQVQ